LKVVRKDKTIWQGKLTAATAAGLNLDVEEKVGKKMEIKPVEIPYSEIEKAIVIVSFK
jgi:ribosome maturation factor RimP